MENKNLKNLRQEMMDKLEAEQAKAEANGQDQEFQDKIASEFFGINDRDGGRGQAQRREIFYQVKKKIGLLHKGGNIKPSIAKTIYYLAKFSVDHQVDNMSISVAGIAFYTGQARTTVLQALRWLEANKVITLGEFPGVKSTPRKILINLPDEWDFQVGNVK